MLQSLRAKVGSLVIWTLDAAKVVLSTWTSELPLSDSIPAGDHVAFVSAREIPAALVDVRGPTRWIVRLGGPGLRIAGHRLQQSDGTEFVPSLWWADKGAKPVRMTSSTPSNSEIQSAR
jgi:hypothetical protein